MSKQSDILDKILSDSQTGRENGYWVDDIRVPDGRRWIGSNHDWEQYVEETRQQSDDIEKYLRS